MDCQIDNCVAAYPNAFSKDFCGELIEFFTATEAAGFTRTRQQREPVLKNVKDDSSVIAPDFLDLRSTRLYSTFIDTFWDFLFPIYADKFSTLQFSDPLHIYEMKLQRTNVGQGYHAWHFESSGRSTSNRVLAFSLFLNDVAEGGEMEFLYYPRRVKAEAGTFLLWPAGFTHTHRGNPPLSNTKYILTGWVEF
jgi:hypothetical protein